jgi:hypothetical protein
MISARRDEPFLTLEVTKDRPTVETDMAPQRAVLCTHCGEYISRKQEIEHRKLATAPYMPSPPRLPSRMRRIVEVEVESVVDAAVIGLLVEAETIQNNTGQRVADDNPNELEDAILNRWSHPAPFDEEPNNDEAPDAYQIPAEDDQCEVDESYLDWDAIWADSGLSTWDKLGESYERNAATICESGLQMIFFSCNFMNVSCSAKAFRL